MQTPIKVQLSTKNNKTYYVLGLTCPKPAGIACNLLEFSDAGVKKVGTPLGTARSKNKLVEGKNKDTIGAVGSIRVHLEPDGTNSKPMFSIRISFHLANGKLWSSTVVEGAVYDSKTLPFTVKSHTHLTFLGTSARDFAVASKMDDLWVAVGAGDDQFVSGDDSVRDSPTALTTTGTSLPTTAKRSQDEPKASRNQKKSRTKQ